MSTVRSSVRAAAIQMNSGNHLQENLQSIERLLMDAQSRGVEIAFLPENLAYVGVQDDDKLIHAEEPGSGPIQEFLADAARRHGLWVVAGSIPLKSATEGKCFGASLVFAADGSNRATYRKIHLFDVDLPDRDESYRESATMDHGKDPIVVDTPLGKLGLSICYDLRFPELYRRLVDDGATVFSVPSAFTAATGQAHWRTLLRARAIENLAYVIAPGQFGDHPNGRTTHGHSMIVDPWGQILAQSAHNEAVVDAEIDVALPGRLRADFPVLRHRRF